MVTSVQYAQIINIFPVLSEISLGDWEASEPQIRNFADKTVVFNALDFEQFSIFILRGKVRVTSLAENGKVIAMNQLNEGDICALMVLSTMSQREYLGYMTAEESLEALFIKKSSFLQWIGMYCDFRRYIFEDIADGLIYYTNLFHKVLLQRLDLKLANLLIEKTSITHSVLRMTHEEVAIEIGSAREVVTRMLKRFKNQGLIETGRGYLRILKRRQLKNLDIS